MRWPISPDKKRPSAFAGASAGTGAGTGAGMRHHGHAHGRVVQQTARDRRVPQALEAVSLVRADDEEVGVVVEDPRGAPGGPEVGDGEAGDHAGVPASTTPDWASLVTDPERTDWGNRANVRRGGALDPPRGPGADSEPAPSR